MTDSRRLKYVLLGVVVAFLATVMTACVDEDVISSDMNSDNLSVLRLSTISRSDGHYPDDPYAEQPETKREEAIDRVDLFFFIGRNDTRQAFYSCEFTNVKSITTADLLLRIPNDLKSTFIDKKVYVYALVNLPEAIRVDVSSNTINGKVATMTNLQELWVSSPELINSAMPSNFVMRGGGDVSVSGSDKDMRITGNIMLERLASKIRLWASIPDHIYIDAEGNTISRNEGESDAEYEARAKSEAHETWESAPTSPSGESNVRMFLYNAATNGRIDAYTGEPGAVADLGYGDVDRESDPNIIRHLLNSVEGLNTADIDTKYPWTHTTAYYSYPNKWDSKSPTEENQTYLIISVPWRRVTSASTGVFENCYYQIPVNAVESNGMAADCLEPNCYYRIKLSIGMLGSKNFGSDLPVPDASYEVVPWSLQPIDVNIKNSRYLVVNQKEWVMNNVYNLSIPFFTSHKTEIVACYVTYFRYNDNWGYDIDTDPNNGRNPIHNKEEFNAWIDAATAQLPGGKEGEGYIVADFDGTKGNGLYYKSEYFKDPYLGYKYYLGHEHPITLKKDFINHPSSLNSAEEALWEVYNSQFRDINGNTIDAVYKCEIDHDKKVINISHPLIQWEERKSGNEIYYVPSQHPRLGGLDNEFSRCEISIIIKHEDWDSEKDGLYTETIHITQYPALYVEVSHYYGDIWRSDAARGNEYILVNGHTTVRNMDATYWIDVTGSVTYFGDDNRNPNMYVIHTSHLSDDLEETYRLGDPRTLFYNNNLTDDSMNKNTDVECPGALGRYSWSWFGYSNSYPSTPWTQTEYLTQATRLEDNTSSFLKYYYPTDESTGAGSKREFIAPSFRIASSFGKVTLNKDYTSFLGRANSRVEARRRCASYQEGGRPAGRWRVPTYAEIKYLVQLAADKKIPQLFGYPPGTPYYYDWNPYWSANGLVAIRSSDCAVKEITLSETTDFPAVRCVYDEWYWTQIDGTDLPTPNKDFERTFYWGDVYKENTQAQRILGKYVRNENN